MRLSIRSFAAPWQTLLQAESISKGSAFSLDWAHNCALLFED